MAGCRRAKYKGGRQKSTIRRPTGGVISVRGHGAIRTGGRARAKPEFVKAIMWDLNCCEHFLGSELGKKTSAFPLLSVPPSAKRLSVRVLDILH